MKFVLVLIGLASLVNAWNNASAATTYHYLSGKK